MGRKLSEILCAAILATLFSSCSATRHVSTEYAPVKTDYVGKGTLETIFCKSSQPGLSERRMFVYLPENYYDTDIDYPVLYLLHGARGTETSWIEKGHIMQNVDMLVSEGKVKPMIVVMPNCNEYDNDADYAMSRQKPLVESVLEVNGAVETYFVTDVMETVDSLYRTIRSKHGRAIAGLSVGALQTIFITALNPELFDYIGLFSPMIKPVFHYGEHSGFYRDLKKRLTVQFATPPKLYSIMAGKWDIFFASTEQFNFYLKTHDYPHEYYMSGGGHNWRNWEKYSVRFIQGLWNEDGM